MLSVLTKPNLMKKLTCTKVEGVGAFGYAVITYFTI